ncbi:MAG: N-acetylmuramoyl-L-alanine amidase [Spirochaetaceae bacterium]|jgi:N-acetylmuramoyl-L-alanine amidase|nr:N-acetylmuramoyl-L-alanine amidase [Spirochaetaceae bacterium]
MKKNYTAAVLTFLLSLNINAQTALSVQPAAPSSNAATDTSKALTLNETMDMLDGELLWDPLFQSGIITTNDHKVVFQTGNAGESAPILYDNKTLLTLPSPYTENGQLRFPQAFVSSLMGSIEESLQREVSRFSIAAIVIDPGHGGKDGGAASTLTLNGKKVKVVEKDITLKVSKELYEMLRKKFPAKQIMLTRTGDTYPSLEDRVNKAHAIPLKENEAVIFISVHANASFNKKASGYEVWYLSPEYRRDVIDPKAKAGMEEIALIYNDMLEEQFTTESVLMAQSILRNFNEEFGKALPSRGIKAEEWFVVRKARMPSVLVELGFVSNENDAALMTSGSGQKRFADAIYKGVLEFVENFEKSGGFTEVANR